MAEVQEKDEQKGAEAETKEGNGIDNPIDVPDRVLSQEEIDNLLGINTAKKPSRQGIGILIDSASVSHERLPMLEVVFDRLVRLMSTTLRNMTSDNVEVSLENMTTIRFGDYLNSIPTPALINVFRMDEWGTTGLILADNPLTFALIEVLLGGRRQPSQNKIEGRGYTSIEQKLIERIIRLILEDFTKSFEPVEAIHFSFDRMEANPKFATIVQHNSAAVLTTLKVEMDQRRGKIEFLMPYSSIEPAREKLLQNYMGEKFGQDNIWENHLAYELWQTSIEAQAILDQVVVKLGDVMGWKKGDYLPLDTAENSSITLRSGDRTLYTGRVGHKLRNVAVRIEKNCLQEEEEDEN